MAEIPCPRCQSPVDSTAEACPFCHENLRSYVGTVQGVAQYKRQSPWPALLGLLLLFIAAYVGRKALKKLKPESAAPAAAVPAPIAKAAAPAGPQYDELAAAEKTGSWRINGLFFEALTLKPVGQARLLFRSARTSKVYSAVTNVDGRFDLPLPFEPEGFLIATTLGGRLMEDTDPPLGSLEPDARKTFVANTPPEAFKPKVSGESASTVLKNYAFVPAGSAP